MRSLTLPRAAACFCLGSAEWEQASGQHERRSVSGCEDVRCKSNQDQRESVDRPENALDTSFCGALSHKNSGRVPLCFVKMDSVIRGAAK